jgi:hypothetical protein
MSRLRPIPETQNGGRQTGSSCISRSILDSVEIPKPTHRFSGSTKSSDSPLTPSNIDRDRKHTMAAARLEVVLSCFGISTLSSIEREIQLPPVWQPPSCVSGLGRCRDIVDLCCQFHIILVQFTGTINSVFMSFSCRGSFRVY